MFNSQKPALSWSEVRTMCATNRYFADANHWLIPLLNAADDWPTSRELNHASARVVSGFPWTFITAPKIPRRSKSKGMTSLSGYVDQICRQRQIPMRENSLHDFLNATSFLMFPHSKLALNERHRKESPLGLKPGQNRTRTQDLLTMFDEGGVLRLKGCGQHKDLIFGHAVYEHLIFNKRIRAARLDIPVADSFFANSIPTLTAQADLWFAQWLENPLNCLASDEFSHVWVPDA